VSAAVQLSKAGHKVAVFEANNYLGGRIKTTPLNFHTGVSVQFE
jgi:phytoene dehydrogenase-like protein